MSTKHPDFQTATLDAWLKAAAKSAPGGQVDALNWTTPDGITVKPLYTAADVQQLPYANTLPGFEPFLRGPQATMYSVRPWTIRQYAGFSTAEESNAFYRKALAAGGQGVSFVKGIDQWAYATPEKRESLMAQAVADAVKSAVQSLGTTTGKNITLNNTIHTLGDMASLQSSFLGFLEMAFAKAVADYGQAGH